MEFFEGIETPFGAFALILALGVVFLNGFTDAPNAIATVVATGTLSMNKACVISSLFNFLGLALMYFINNRVAKSVGEIADFSNNSERALFVVFLSVVAFTVFTWLLSIPSSESHALISAVAGVGVALNGKINLTAFFKIILYMILSCIVSAFISVIISKFLTKAVLPYKKLQILTCATTSFMHGAQDGQKLLGIMLLIASEKTNYNHIAPFLLVSVTLFLGTLLGGGKITKLVGEQIAKLTDKSAFIADLASSACTLACSVVGAPVSTSNIKASAIATSALCDNKKVNVKTLVRIIYVALATFPACIFLSYIIAKLVF